MATHILITSRQYLLDTRPPQDIQACLERATGVVFAATDGAAAETRRARIAWHSTEYRFSLRLLDALPQGNSYSLDIEVDFDAAADKDPAMLQAERRWSEGQIRHWTSDLQLLPLPAQGVGSTLRHQALLQDWCAAEARLADVPATQQAILQALREGAAISMLHQEGRTTMRWERRCFVSIESGKAPQTRRFASDREFLDHLRAAEEHRISWHARPAPAHEAEVWRLLYRQLEHRPSGGTGPGLQARAVKAVAVAAACGIALGLVCLKVQRGAESRRAAEHHVQWAQPATRSDLDAIGERSRHVLSNARKFNERVRDDTRAKPQRLCIGC